MADEIQTPRKKLPHFLTHKTRQRSHNNTGEPNDNRAKENTMKATGIVRRIDDLGRVVIPKEIRRTMRIREGDPTLKIWENWMIFSICILKFSERIGLR